MTWTVDTNVQVQNLISQIATRLTGGGWTEADAGNRVYQTTNDHGAQVNLQISEGGSYQYIQLKGWRLWSGGVGTDGSAVTATRIYYAGVNVAGTTTVDLYMSVTTNRVIIFINGYANWRNWAYCGGLGSINGANDPTCVYLIASFNTASVYDLGYILQYVGGSSAAYWQVERLAVPAFVNDADTPAVSGLVLAQGVGSDPSKVVIYPILCLDPVHYTGIGAPVLRGDLDGLFYCPVGSNIVGHLSTISISGVTYLVIIPGGQNAANTHPVTGNYNQGLAIAEV